MFGKGPLEGTGESASKARIEITPLYKDGRYMIDDSDFTLVELDYVLCRVKKNTMAGNDGIPGEWYKWLDGENKKLLLHAANVCLRQGNIDPCHLNAVVVSIYERDDATTRERLQTNIIIGGVL